VSARVAVLIACLLIAQAASAATFRGRIVESERGGPVPHAFVTINGTVHVEADSSGWFKVDNLPAGNATIRIEHVAYMPFEREIRLREDRPTELAIRLRLRVQTIEPVDIGATRPDPSVPQGKRTITAMQIRRAAGGVATDPLRVIQALPGSAAAGDDFSNRYVVRGGDPEENTVLYDDYFLLQPVHLEGFTSVIYDDLVGSVDLYPGALPPRFGDALSSVTLLGASRPEKNRRFFRYDLGSIALGGQVARERTTAIAAARTSFYNLIVRRPPGVKTRSFQDVAGKAERQGDRVETSATLVGSRDRETGDVDRAIDSYLAGMRIASLPGLDKWHVGASMSYRKSNVKLTRRPYTETKGELLRPEVFGQVLRNISPDFQARVDGAVRQERFDDTIHKHSGTGGFASAEGTYATSFASISMGGRVEKIPFTRTVPVSPYVSFRVRGLGPVTPGGAYRIVRQSPFALNESYEVAGLPVDAGELLTLIEGKVDPLRADHMSASLEAELGHGFNAGIEVYRKRYTNLLTWKLVEEGPHRGEMIDSTVTSGGSGTGTGCEITIRREKGRVTGVASYTISRTRKKEGPATGLTNSDYDRPRMFQFSVDIPIRGGTSCALAYRASTGRPITPLIAIGNGNVMPGEINSDRLPSYRRLDFKLEHRVLQKKTEAFIYLDVLNILNRKNVVDLIQFNGAGGQIVRIESQGVRILPVAGFGFYF
jgi:hypothetical protein